MNVLKVGKSDALERKYLAKFRALAAPFGEFVTYERDRGARDIGLHFTRRQPSGEETVATALRWFQHKGIAATTLDADAIRAADEVKVTLDVKHLKLWYMFPDPTYLVVYLEAVDQFLVVDIQAIVQRRWGRKILSLAQETATVDVPTSSVLDDAAFQLILARSDVEWLTRFCGATHEQARLAIRDCDLIVAIAEAEKRNAKIELRFTDWISKTRSEVTLVEIGPSGEELPLQFRWLFMLSIEHLESHLPWISFTQAGRHIYDWLDDEAAEEEDYEPWDDEDLTSAILPSGRLLYGEEAAGELVEYRMYVKLNEFGRTILEWLTDMKDAGQLVVDPSAGEWVSVAPWERRSV